MAQNCCVNNVRIVGVDADSGNTARIGQPFVFPGFTAINRFPNSVSVRDVPANGDFAAANIDDVGI